MNMRISTFIVLLLLAWPLVSRGETQQQTAVSRITGVTVYADRALVTRSAALTLKPGTNLITFANLPLLMAEDSQEIVLAPDSRSIPLISFRTYREWEDYSDEIVNFRGPKW